ncbi:MAG: hypothetical protein ACN4EP_15235 [Sediminibacterium sp.]|nr:hypothetical protein [uncultured Sediminibacterium sp.]
MKKFQILGTVLLLSVVTTLLVACQKEQDGVTNEVSKKATDEESVTAIQVSASDIPGIINKNEASSLAARYAAARINKSTAVAFSVKDIQNYLYLLRKAGSKNIYVNFGLYDNGRLTVFFSGDKRSGSGSIRNSDFGSPSDGEDFLNHGGLVP